MKSKRLLIVLAVLGLVAAACASDGGQDDTTTTGGTETTAPPASGESLLDTVIARGNLECGVNETLAGFGFKDAAGAFVGFDVDFCRAVAAAVLGDANLVNFTSLTSSTRFEALASGQIDVLSRNTTWTQSRDTELGFDFAPTTYFDGQQLMGRAEDGFDGDSQLADIEGAIVCTNAGTSTEQNITEITAANNITITLQTFEDFNIVIDNFIARACDVVTSDGSGLAARKFVNQPDDQEWVIFPGQPFSKEPLGPTYRQGDGRWGDVINFVVLAMFIGEELGVNQANVDEMAANPPDGEVGRLLGVTDDECQTAMGLPADAFYQMIKQVGNYKDLYEKHLTPLNLERVFNALWTDGGLLFSPPFKTC